MAILPQNTNPLMDYVDNVVSPPLTMDGLVYNGVYAYTGVVDTLTQNKKTGYTDPNLNVTNGINNSIAFQQVQSTSWISATDFGGTNSAPVILTYNLSSTTYYNTITFDVLNVPCYVELGYYAYDTFTGLYDTWTALPGDSSFIIAGGSNIYTTTDWLRQQYIAPTTLSGVNNIALRITREQLVQSANYTTGPTNIAYSVGVGNFNIKLQITQKTDVPNSVVSGTSSITTQNRFNFAENYTFSNNPVANVFSGAKSGVYWKSGPQPTSDSIVFFYAKVSDPAPTTINRLYVNPMYSKCSFNVYYTTNTGSADPGTFVWTPIQRDFVLRKGIYEIPTVTCTYLKFEFTKLVAEPYDLPFDSVSRQINVFPYDVEEYYSSIETNIADANAVKYSPLGSSTVTQQNVSTQRLSNSTLFGYASNAVSNTDSWPSLTALNASQMGNTSTVGMNTLSSVVDPSSSYKTINENGKYNHQSYTQFLQRRFPDTRVHSYTTINIQQTWHQAYFAGIQYITAFYEKKFDDLTTTPGSFISSNGTTSGFVSQNINYVGLNPDTICLTPWYNTIDTFKSFNIAGLTTDWQSFLTDDQVLLNDTYDLIPINSKFSKATNLGTSSVIAFTQASGGQAYGVKTGPYPSSNNLAGYNDANFLPASGTALAWTGLGSTTVTGVTVTGYVSGYATVYSGMSVSGGSFATSYTFTIPNTYSPSGTQAWKLDFGTPSLGTIGYATYIPASGSSFGGFNYYFFVNAQTPGNALGVPTSGTTISAYTQYLDPNNSNAVIPGTTFSGSTVTVVSGTGSNILTITGTNSTTNGLPSNTLRFVVSGTNSVPYNLFQFGIYDKPALKWTGVVDRTNMRVSGVARILLPFTNNGTYRASLLANDQNGTQTELAYKQYGSNSLPTNTWIDLEVEAFSGTNYTNFVMQLEQTNTSVSETFYTSLLSPFYHPVRYEYITSSGATNWQPITLGINNPNSYIATISGLPASGIQVRATGLDGNVFISGISIIPKYKQSPYYADLYIDYLGTSKTNEVSSRRDIAHKPYFLLNTYPYPERFNLNNIASTVTNYYID